MAEAGKFTGSEGSWLEISSILKPSQNQEQETAAKS